MGVSPNIIAIGKSAYSQIKSITKDKGWDVQEYFRKGYVSFQQGRLVLVNIDVFWVRNGCWLTFRLPDHPDNLDIDNPCPELEWKWGKAHRMWAVRIPSVDFDISKLIPYFEYNSHNVGSHYIKRDVSPSVNHSPRINRSEWSEWDLPNDEEILWLAQISSKYYKFLNPEIVSTIVDDNESNRKEWTEALTNRGINPELYLWDKSPCAFPGIRRYAGSKEVAAYRGHTDLDNLEIKQALRLDDNDFPKQVWSFIFRGRQFAKFGPDGYSLAHLVDHKEFGNRLKKEFILNEEDDTDSVFYGLYTCPTNTIYVPSNLMKPTDFAGKLRNLLFRKMFALYSQYCNVVPESFKLRQNDDKDWEVSNFDWSEPVGQLDNLDAFLEYRKRIMNELLVKKLT
jgi:hypothetical protein